MVSHNKLWLYRHKGTDLNFLLRTAFRHDLISATNYIVLVCFEVDFLLNYFFVFFPFILSI